MDQTHLPLTFSDGLTYTDKGETSVWVRGGGGGGFRYERHCTVQLTLFADGVPRVKTMLIFKGTVKRITLSERVSQRYRNI